MSSRRVWNTRWLYGASTGRYAVVIGSAALLVAGCSSGETVPDTPGAAPTVESSGFAPGAGVIPAGLQSYYTQTLDWGSCDSYDTELNADVECTRVTVPLDYANPGGAKARIALSRVQASGQKIGSILWNPGGPGASGLYLADRADGTAVADQFDRIGFDPRGIGASLPAVRCLDASETDAERADQNTDVSPEGISRTEAEQQDYARKCTERTGPDVLAHVGTREVAQDMDVIRSVLGDKKLTYVGYSYGTRIGTEYTEMFPQNVRAMVLDGALDPEQGPVDEAVEQGAAFQKAFDEFAANCTQSDACPIGTDPSDAVAQFRSLLNPLLEGPASTADPRGLSYADAITGIQAALYTPQLWRPLRTGLAELGEGRGDALLGLADSYSGRQDDGTYSNLDDAFNAIRCADDPPTTDRAEVAEADARYRRAAPFLDDGRATGQAPLDLCAFWPVPNTGNAHSISASGLPKLVVVSTTNDPATPYRAGIDLARQLAANLVTYQGTQHTVAFSGEECIDQPLVDYLVDLIPPGNDVVC